MALKPAAQEGAAVRQANGDAVSAGTLVMRAYDLSDCRMHAVKVG